MNTLRSFIIVLAVMFMVGCENENKEAQLQAFINSHLEKLKPLSKEANLVSWKAETTGDPDDYEKLSTLRLQISKIYTNSQEYEYLKNLKGSGEIKDPLLVRQLDRLYWSYLKNQIDPELLKQTIDLSTEISKKFNTFRGTIGNREVTANEIKDILKVETDSEKRKDAWQASKQVGPVVAKDIIRLVKLRNQAAKSLGFGSYHSLSLATREQSVEELDSIFDELFEKTNEPFAKLKNELDGILAANCNISITELRPWHYHDPFFQETPMVYELDLDNFYEDKDVVELSRDFYAGIGLPVESILEKSDLYERDGKCPHAFCTDIDRTGDVRILCNVRNNEGWMETMLHELGHGVYDKYNNLEVPYLLRQPTHAFTTEAVAMFFGRLSRNPAWMQTMLGISDVERAEIEEVGSKYNQLKQLIFARWAMVMYNFEKQLYADPDQDLNSLWWDLVEKYQFIKSPAGHNEPDWASKIHIASTPCYYHNYMLGELLASQWHNYIVRNVFELNSERGVCFAEDKRVGDYFRKQVLEAGAVYHWNEMIQKSTGEKLTTKYFVEQFVQ